MCIYFNWKIAILDTLRTELHLHGCLFSVFFFEIARFEWCGISPASFRFCWFLFRRRYERCDLNPENLNICEKNFLEHSSIRKKEEARRTETEWELWKMPTTTTEVSDDSFSFFSLSINLKCSEHRLRFHIRRAWYYPACTRA